MSHLFPLSQRFTLPGLDSVCKSVTVLSGNPRLWDLQWGFLCENMLITLMSDWPDCVLLSCLLNTMWKAPCCVSMTNPRDPALMSSHRKLHQTTRLYIRCMEKKPYKFGTVSTSPANDIFLWQHGMTWHLTPWCKKKKKRHVICPSDWPKSGACHWI